MDWPSTTARSSAGRRVVEGSEDIDWHDTGSRRVANGDYRHLSELVGLAISEPAFTLSRNSKRTLPKLRDVGHLSAHGRYYHATRNDIENAQQDFRIVVEEFLHHAGLL